MQYLVTKWDDKTQREVGIDSDGTVQQNAEKAELFASHSQASTVADQHGGKVITESRMFGDDNDDDDDE